MLPMVFDNLMVPIAQSWAQAKDSQNSRLSFWTYRRARPLVECIPVGPKQLQAMVRGWFTGRLLGQITREQERGSGWRVQIWNPDPPYHGMQPFPFPLLAARAVQGVDLMPAVLQSVLIAMVDVHTKGNLSPLIPYQRLIDIGENAETLLGDWISDGALTPGAPTPDLAIAGTASDTAETRRATIQQALHASRAEHDEVFTKTEHANNPYDVPLAWELRDQIRAAMDALYGMTMVATNKLTVL